jgi:ABC-type multidrug transport system fused ATPase/permease subunit
MPMMQNESRDISTLKRCISVFSSKDKKKIGAVVVLQTLLGGLDLLGVMLIGIIGALAVTGIQSSTPGNRVNSALKLLQLDSFTFQTQTAILGLVATGVLMCRTFLSVIFTRKVLFFIGRRSAVISGNLVSRLLQQDILQINKQTIQQTIYASTNGVVSVTLGVVGTAVSVIADVSLLFVMALGLLFVDPIIALCAFLLFSTVGLGLYQLMHRRASKFGQLDAQLNVRSNEKISEVLTSYREATVRNRRTYYASEIGQARFDLSNVLAELSFMPTISKYVIEATMVLGAVSISAVQFALQDSKHAVATLAVFLAAGTRIAPAILRVQQGAISIKSALGSAQPTLDLLDSLPDLIDKPKPIEDISKNSSFKADVNFESVSFKYPGAEEFALDNFNLVINSGETIAIVGPSGSGKTTLVDLLLGMFEPTSGQVTISGLKPSECVNRYPGAIGYVPQDVVIIEGTIRENIAMGFPLELATNELINNALNSAHLQDLVLELPNGIESNVGPRGSKLSGGQRQRLGIARALFTKPRLLILDESTSALDAQTEVQVTKALDDIPYDITKVIVAHRLSTVRNADVVIYIEGGKIISSGNFDEVRAQVPNFDAQAKLMGL